MLCNRIISWEKVLWKNHLVKEASWEREDDMLSRYPNLFIRGEECNDSIFFF